MTVARISNARATELTGATLPCPPVASYKEGLGGPGIDRLNLRVASMLALADLHEHHKPGAGELDIPRGYGGSRRSIGIVRSPSGCALAGVV